MTNQTIDLLGSKNPSKRLLRQLLETKIVDEGVDIRLAEKANKNVAPFKNSVRLYDVNTIDTLIWPDTEEGRFARNYLLPLVKEGTKDYIENIDVQICVLQLDKHVLPIVISNHDNTNSYVCSPYGHYISLPLESLYVIKNRLLRKISEYVLKGLGKILKRGNIDRVVYVNHWLLSTDLYPPDLSQQQIHMITTFLKEHFPQHTLAFRSLNSKTTGELQNHLKKSGFKFVASRQVYLTDATNEDLYKTRIIKSDLKLWNQKDYEIVEGAQMSSEDEENILKLYRHLSIENHSHLNPQLNVRFIKLMKRHGLLQFKSLKKNGVIDGVVGYFKRNNVLMCPFIGYNKTHQANSHLYRLLCTLLLLEARKTSQTFHQSAGASFYKTIRRATGHLEYLGIYTKHLTLKQRCAWGILKAFTHCISIHFMKKY